MTYNILSEKNQHAKLCLFFDRTREGRLFHFPFCPVEEVDGRFGPNETTHETYTCERVCGFLSFLKKSSFYLYLF